MMMESSVPLTVEDSTHPQSVAAALLMMAAVWELGPSATPSQLPTSFCGLAEYCIGIPLLANTGPELDHLAMCDVDVVTRTVAT